jgi:hypothetical protein
MLLAAWTGDTRVPRPLRTWDPNLEDTLRLSHAAGIVEQATKDRQKLTELGRSLVSLIRNDPKLAFEYEQRVLARLGRISTAGMWRRLGPSPSRSKGRTR